MNLDPFGVRPRAQINNGREPVRIQLSTGRVPTVEGRDRRLQGLFESRQRGTDILRGHAPVGTNANAIGVESRFATETFHV